MSLRDLLIGCGQALVAAAEDGFEDPDDDLGGAPGEDCRGWGDLQEPRDPDDPDDEEDDWDDDDDEEDDEEDD